MSTFIFGMTPGKGCFPSFPFEVIGRLDLLPGLFRRFHILEEGCVLRRDGPDFHQKIEVENPLLKLLSEEKDGDGFDFSGLNQGQNFKKLVHGPVTTGKNDQGFGTHQEMHPTDGEVMELEAELRRDIRIGFLFMGENDTGPPVSR
jgi:hypothetical protein